MKVSNTTITRLLCRYKRWVSEQKPPFLRKDEKRPKLAPQHYYDPYHEHISDNGDGTYDFRIQTCDSPEGDTWVSGRFKADAYGVKILEQQHE